MTSEPVELKPCPFGCGAAEIREWDWPYVRFQVRCPKCKCSQGIRKADKAEAVAAWNQRAPTLTDAEIVEMLARALKRCAEIVERNLGRQDEKVADVPLIALTALRNAGLIGDAR